MSTVIYLANQQIQVIKGTPGSHKISVSECYTADAPDGCIINGIIMDTDSFISFMQNFWEMNHLPVKDITLVVNSTKFIGKTIDMPLLNKKNTEEFIDREFSDIKQNDDYICRYIQIGQSKNTKKIYAEIVTTDFIKDYLDIFNEIGLHVKTVYSGESSLIRLADMTIGKQYKTFILQIADRMTITTILWVNGDYYYLNNTRCFYEQGTEEYAQDVARIVSQIRQFMQANQLDYPIEAIVLAGINPDDMPLYQKAISQLDIYARVEVFEDSHISVKDIDKQMYFPVISGLVVNNMGKQNFIDGYNSGKKKVNKKEKGLGKGILAITISLAVMLIAVFVSMTIRKVKENRLNELTDYNDSPNVIMEVARYSVLLQETTYLTNQYNAIEGLNDNLKTYPVCDSEIIDIVNDCADGYASVVIDSFDADLGVMAVTATADSVDNINKFIKNISAVDIFDNVDYTGYSFVESTGLWDIHVTFTLAESAGR